MSVHEKDHGSDAVVDVTDAQILADVEIDHNLLRLGHEVIERQKRETFAETWRNHWRAAIWSLFISTALWWV
jgi:SP family general alpha glucoside:H+ symporter-like MFS transporter